MSNANANANAELVEYERLFGLSPADVSDVEIRFDYSSRAYWTCKKTNQRYRTQERPHDFGLACIPKFHSVSKIYLFSSVYDHKIRGMTFVKHTFYLVPEEAENITPPIVMNIL